MTSFIFWVKIFLLQVTNWLNEILGHDNVPQFEINAINIQILRDIMMKNEMQEQVVSALIADVKLKAEEYHVECK